MDRQSTVSHIARNTDSQFVSAGHGVNAILFAESLLTLPGLVIHVVTSQRGASVVWGMQKVTRTKARLGATIPDMRA